jgi:hypothetical protein
MTANEPLFYSNRDHVIALAAGRAIYTDRLFVEAGGLMSYGASGSEAFRLVIVGLHPWPAGRRSSACSFYPASTSCA